MGIASPLLKTGGGLLTGGAVAAASTLLLDSISGVSACFSFRRLLTAYAGNCCNIVRASDSATQDFGFVLNVVDVASIATFLAATTGKVVTWYDQSGNGNDVTNTTNRPAYNATRMNSLPVAENTAGTSVLKKTVTATNILAATQGTFIAAINQFTNATNAVWGLGASTELLAAYSGSIYFDYGSTSGTGRVNAASPGGWENNNHVIEGYRATGGTQEILIDGTSLISASRSAAPSGSVSFTLFSESAEGIPMNGAISEIIFFNNDIGSTARATIRKNGVGVGAGQASMGTYFGITVA